MSFLFLAFCLLILSPLTFAQTATKSPTLKDARQDIMKTRQNIKTARLDGAKLKVCQTKEKTITNRLNSLTRLVTNQEDKFNAITTRVENFYATRVVAQGKTVSNYDSLVADIAAKKTAVDSSLATAKTNAGNFSCTGDDPKGALTQYREDMQAVKSALKDYRTSIKNLIQAVKGALGESSEGSPTP